MLIGILAIQGAVSLHEEKLQSLGIPSRRVKKTEELKELSGLILPGGESSTMIHLLKLNGLWDEIKSFVKNRPSWGLCAGAILLAQEVESPSQESLQALDISVIRNAYGRQTESFIVPLKPSAQCPLESAFEGVFIRAPQIKRLGKGLTPLFTFQDKPVMVQSRYTLASTFHPELTNDARLHQYFVKICQEFA